VPGSAAYQQTSGRGLWHPPRLSTGTFTTVSGEQDGDSTELGVPARVGYHTLNLDRVVGKQMSYQMLAICRDVLRAY